MTVVTWIVEATWPACVEAVRRYTTPDTDVVLLHVTDPDVADVAHGAYAGLLGRRPRRDPGGQVESLASAAAHNLLDEAAARLGRRCTNVERTGRVEREVVGAAGGAELLILARDGELGHLGPGSLGHATRFIVDHAPCPVLLVWPVPPPAIDTLPTHP
ncbi:MAG: universal stress protein [Mycobacteriaceae bacterium]|nr:universal stress protein [Mycobacteriaceae bacterium]